MLPGKLSQKTALFDLVRRLNSGEAWTRAQAHTELLQTPTEDLMALWKQYYEEQAKARWFLLMSSVPLGVTLLLALATGCNFGSLGYAAASGLLFLFVLAASSRVTPWKRAIHGLKCAEDVRVIEPLTENIRDSGVQETMVRLLPRLQLSDAVWFSEASRNRIRSVAFSLFLEPRQDLVEAFLRGMTAIGDRDTLVNIMLLIVRDAPTAHSQHLREVARECLPQLQANAFGDRVEEIPALIESLPAVPAINSGLFPNKQCIAVLGLAHLLPRLTSADAHLLTSELRRRLCANLGGLSLKEDFLTISRLGPDFSFSVIGALTRFGGEESLHTLERCAEGKYSLWQLSPQDGRRMQLAASLALPVVQERVAAERESETLLRGSQAPEPAADTLLRPASAAVPDTESQQLLRTTNTPSNQ